MRRFSRLLSVLATALLTLGPVWIGPVAAQETTPAATPGVAGQAVRLRGADIYYEVHGAGDPVVLLHGGLGSSENFANQIPALAEHYQVIAIDGRGQGRSSRGTEPLSFALMASDVVGVLDHLGIEQAHVVGWSMGASVGLQLAIDSPERVDKLVAYGAAVTPEGFLEATPSPELDAMFATIAADYQRLSPEPEGFEAVATEIFALVEAPAFGEAQLRGITVPVLILDGAEEEMIAPEHPVWLAELIPNSELVIMPGTGHFAPYEQPEAFNQIVLEFLQA